MLRAKNKNQLYLPAIAIIGPTSSGKSDIAIEVAKKIDGEVLSVDSRQIYRGMNIGSGKVPGYWDTKKNVYVSEGIPHYGIDIAHPMNQYSVAKFQKKALIALKKIRSHNKIPILCGGTGFWMQALIEGYLFPKDTDNTSPQSQSGRFERFDNQPTSVLYALLKKKDLKRALAIHPNNRRYITRALEILEHQITVEPLIKDPKLAVKSQIFSLERPKEELNLRIETRLKERLEQGMIDEAYTLHHNHRVTWKRLVEFGLEYRWTTRYLRSEITRTEMHKGLLRDIRHYAKRQRTWTRRWKRINPGIISASTTNDILKKYSKTEKGTKTSQNQSKLLF